jgi:hypothetical protein
MTDKSLQTISKGCARRTILSCNERLRCSSCRRFADWNDMSRHRRFPDVLDERITPESIAEDYLYNARHLNTAFDCKS